MLEPSSVPIIVAPFAAKITFPVLQASVPAVEMYSAPSAAG
jgi:hypothetical protein